MSPYIVSVKCIPILHNDRWQVDQILVEVSEQKVVL